MKVEHRIGEVVTYDGVECVVANQDKSEPQLYCADCFLYEKEWCQQVRCAGYERPDKTSVIFIPTDKFALMRLKSMI